MLKVGQSAPPFDLPDGDMNVVSLDGYRGIASPIKLSRTPATYRLAPP